MALQRLGIRIALILMACGLLLAWQNSEAVLTDTTQTPNTVNAGIHKSLAQEIGPGRGTDRTPGSALYLIRRDPLRAVRRGRQLFHRKFTRTQGQGPRVHDGIGDIERDPRLGAGLTDACASCHNRPKGSAGVGGSVFTRPEGRDAPHLFGIGLVEELADEITWDLRRQRDAARKAALATGKVVRRRLRSKGIDYGVLVAHPDGSLDNSGLSGIDPDLRVKPFMAEGSVFSIRDFIVNFGFKPEMGLEAWDPDLAAAARGQRVVTPSGLVLDGSQDHLTMPPVSGPQEDGDGDGVVAEIDPAVVDYLEFYLLNYFRPAEYRQTRLTRRGHRLFRRIGCADCHRENLVVEHDRRVADVDTRYDEQRGIFNHLYATVSARFVSRSDVPGLPPLKLPAGRRFVVRGIYADFKRHDLGPAFYERNFDGSWTRAFMTEPLWGVGSTAPYGHDGRSVTLHEVILRHGGEAAASRDAYEDLRPGQQEAVLAFLRSLVLFPPDDTASNLDPGDRSAPGFPQYGHGSIRLSVLFNDPSDPE